MEFLLPILLAGFFPVAVIYLLVSHSRLKKTCFSAQVGKLSQVTGKFSFNG